MPHKARRRGAPLAMLALVLAGWGAARALLWEEPRFMVRIRATRRRCPPARGAARRRNSACSSRAHAGRARHAPRAAPHLPLPQVEAGGEMAPGERTAGCRPG
jgi:hypothetical protein